MTAATPEPTPAEIGAECQRIQEGWTEKERARRYVGDDPRWLAKLWPDCPEDGALRLMS